jgi:hypothetical protein
MAPPEAWGSRGNKAPGRSFNKRPRTAGPSRQQTARKQDNDGNDGDEGDDQEVEEEEDDEEGQRSEATTKGGPAASSVKRRHIYRGILMNSIKLQNLAPLSSGTNSRRPDSCSTLAAFSLSSLTFRKPAPSINGFERRYCTNRALGQARRNG